VQVQWCDSYHSAWKHSAVRVIPILTRKFRTKSSTTSGGWRVHTCHNALNNILKSTIPDSHGQTSHNKQPLVYSEGAIARVHNNKSVQLPYGLFYLCLSMSWVIRSELGFICNMKPLQHKFISIHRLLSKKGFMLKHQ